MELNREQIIKALECCTDGAGECDDCPLIHDNFCGKHLLRNTLSLIKALTEENERLRGCVMSEEQVRNIANETIQQGIFIIKVDTVRKMQSELKKTISALCKGEMNDLYRIIDQITKEMIGGEND